METGILCTVEDCYALLRNPVFIYIQKEIEARKELAFYGLMDTEKPQDEKKDLIRKGELSSLIWVLSLPEQIKDELEEERERATGTSNGESGRNDDERIEQPESIE
jgi:hypothetical protein